MRSTPRILFFLVSIALLCSACSSTTAVARDELANADDQETAPAQTDDAADDAQASVSAEDADAADAADTDEDLEPVSARDLETAAGFGLGSPEQLGTLSDDCIAGNDMACDILFQVSGFDSDEEATALSCGGRNDEPATFCTPDIEADSTGLVFDESSSGLPAIVTACVDAGDMTACDFLYFRSPLQSNIEATGATCGERVDVAIPDCRTFLPQD